MDSATLAGAGLVIAKMSAFALMIYASRSATRAVREVEARKAAAGVAERPTCGETAAEAAAGSPVAPAAPVTPRPARAPEPA